MKRNKKIGDYAKNKKLKRDQFKKLKEEDRLFGIKKTAKKK